MQKGATQTDKTADFRKLHESGCFVIPNPWDAGTAKYLTNLGFKALATTSAGLGLARGIPDPYAVLPLEWVLENATEIVSATQLPVTVDFQNGYARDPDDIEVNVHRCVATGVAGLSIEDTVGDADNRLYDTTLAAERIRAARKQIDSLGIPVVLTARCEAWLVHDSTPLQTSVSRLVAYAEAGADCLYAPGVYDLSEIETLVKAVSPKPLNVLISQSVPGLDVRHLADVGVRRISIGSGLNRLAWRAFMKAARDIFEFENFESLSDLASFEELNREVATSS
jgi:2-methylisocitrate lyase-like PEP mutase family enzyme